MMLKEIRPVESITNPDTIATIPMVSAVLQMDSLFKAYSAAGRYSQATEIRSASNEQCT